MAGPVPQVSQRWIVPVPDADGAAPAAVPAGALRTRGGGAATVSFVHRGAPVHGVALPPVQAGRVVLG